MLIIMAISADGRPIFENGFKSCSIPSVSCIGVVVSVNRDEPIMSIISLTTILTAINTPSRVTFIKPICNSICVPLVVTTFKNAVRNTIKSMLLMPLNINFAGTFDAAIVRARAAIENAYEYISFIIKSITTKAIVPSIFTLGSSLCIQESDA